MTAAENPAVRRSLKDRAMDHIDHAIGRPVWPLRASYRNHFAVEVDSDLAADFEASEHWTKGRVSGGMAFYHVTDAGRRALAVYLDGLDDDQRRRAFVVTFDGHPRIVPAKTRASARYSEWLTISDSWSELTFAEFMKRSTVRLAP